MNMTVDGLLAERNSATVWMCERGHFLGLAVRKGGHGRWRSQLLKFRHAAVRLGDEVEVDAVVEGRVSDIVCDVCEGKRTWFG